MYATGGFTNIIWYTKLLIFQVVLHKSVYPWRNFSLLLITSNSATGTPI